MVMTRWQPLGNLWEELTDFRSALDGLFNRYHHLNGHDSTTGFPQLCAWEEGEDLFVEAELPGMTLEDLEIFVLGGNQLTIKGERRYPETGQSTWHRRERGFGKFSRTVTLPFDVDADKIEARLKQGVLTLLMPKSEAAKPRKSEVKTG